MATRRVEFHEGAAADLESAVMWYRERSPKAALDFVEELERAIKTIRDAPERWPLGAHNTRRFLLWHFPFAIIYSVENSVITVWAVAHGSRRPGYWTKRKD